MSLPDTTRAAFLRFLLERNWVQLFNFKSQFGISIETAFQALRAEAEREMHLVPLFMSREELLHEKNLCRRVAELAQGWPTRLEELIDLMCERRINFSLVVDCWSNEYHREGMRNASFIGALYMKVNEALRAKYEADPENRLWQDLLGWP